MQPVDAAMESFTLAASGRRLSKRRPGMASSEGRAPLPARGALHASGVDGTRLVSEPTRLRVALFGAGLVGQAGHAPTLWDERDRFEFVAVADPSATVRAAVSERYAVPHAVASLEEALALDLDAVVIAVPDPAHRSAVLTALRAGVHVFCEKPLAVSLAECDEILAERGDRVVQGGYMKLYDPAVERMVERLTAGPAELVYLSVEVNDPDQAPFVDHLGLVVGRDVPQG